MIRIKRRRQHTGTLAFVSFVFVADILGAYLTYLYGATVIPWFLAFLLWIGEEVLHYAHSDLLSILLLPAIMVAVLLGGLLESRRVGGFALLGVVLLWGITRFLLGLRVTTPFVPIIQVGRFPDVLSTLTHRNLHLGGLWLVAYLLLHLITRDPDSLIPEVQQRSKHLAKKAQARALPPSKDIMLVEGSLQEPQDEVVVLNPLYLNEEKAHLLRACEQRYDQALTRFSPSPIPHLKLPGRYVYVVQGDRIVWRGRTPVLTEELLNPVNGNRLLTEYARALFAYNTTDLWLRRVMQFYPDSNLVWLLFFPIGIFLWVPYLVKELLGWEEWRATRILDADRFAWMLGQGELLLHQLRQRQARAQAEEDTNMPTLTERIGHLEGLLNEEHRQMQRQGIPTTESLAKTKTLQRVQQ